MLAIFTALPAEARACIDYFELKRERSTHAFALYQGSDMLLAVTGIGKLRAAAVSASVLTAQAERLRFVLNLGCCGAPAGFALGEAFLAQRVTDHASHSDFFPDLLLSTRFKEAPLVTLDRPLTSGSPLAEYPHALYDMEASGVFQSARMFLPSSAVQAIKVVSDHLNPTLADFSTERIEGLFRPLMPALDSYLRAALRLQSGGQEHSTEPEQIERICSLLGLSFSQRQVLIKRAALLPRALAEQQIESYIQELLQKGHNTPITCKQTRKLHFQNFLLLLEAAPAHLDS
jgi:nucleoside phosphorylase